MPTKKTSTKRTMPSRSINPSAIEVANQDGKMLSLQSFAGKTIVLYFYPKDLTSGCTTEARDFQSLLPEFKKIGALVLGVSRDSAARHRKFADQEGLTFDLLADEEGLLCEAFGVWKEKSMYGRKYMGIERTTFVIGPSGDVVESFEKVKVTGHAQAVLETLRQLRQSY